MIAVVQRVSTASVQVDGETVGAVDAGLLVLLGVGDGDTEAEAQMLAQKVAHLRIFEDEQGKMNRSVIDERGSVLVVSQFTLLGDCRKGRRPSFKAAAAPDIANKLYERFVELLSALDVPVETGQFQAQMSVALINNGPVTLILDTQQWRSCGS